MARSDRGQAVTRLAIALRHRLSDVSGATRRLVHGFALGRNLLQNVVQNALRLKLLNDLVSVELVEFGVLGDGAFEPLEELVLLQVLLDGALDLLHLHICDLLAALTCCGRAGNSLVLHVCTNKLLLIESAFI